MDLSLFAISILVILTGLGATSIHRVPEGHVAVYYRGEALMHERHIDGPGFRSCIPFVDRAAYVQYTVQTDHVIKVPCGTKGGTMIWFDTIEVVNMLMREWVYYTVRNFTEHYDQTWIYKKIHHELNQICSVSTLEEMYITKFDTLDETLQAALETDIRKFVPGLRLLAIRVTKPRIPDAIRQNYEAIETERTKLKVAEQTQKLVEKEAETEHKRALIEANKAAAVEAVQLKRSLAKKENEEQLAAIANRMHIERAGVEAKANKMLLTEEKLRLEAIRNLANNTKVFWGEKLPQVYMGMNEIMPQTDKK